VKEIVSQVDALSFAVQQTQRLAEVANAAARQAERQAAYDAWKDPEEIEKRRKANEEASQASLAYLQTVMAPEDDIEIPDPLPPEMVGQPLSTIKKMLRHKRDGEGYNPYRKIEFTPEAAELEKPAQDASEAAISVSAQLVEKHISRAEAADFNPEAAPLKVFDESVTVKEIQKSTVEKLSVVGRFWRWLTQ